MAPPAAARVALLICLSLSSASALRGARLRRRRASAPELCGLPQWALPTVPASHISAPYTPEEVGEGGQGSVQMSKIVAWPAPDVDVVVKTPKAKNAHLELNVELLVGARGCSPTSPCLPSAPVLFYHGGVTDAHYDVVQLAMEPVLSPLPAGGGAAAAGPPLIVDAFELLLPEKAYKQGRAADVRAVWQAYAASVSPWTRAGSPARDLDALLAFVQQVLLGAQLLEERGGIRAKDIKLENVMLDGRAGTAKIIDLGLGCFSAPRPAAPAPPPFDAFAPPPLKYAWAKSACTEVLCRQNALGGTFDYLSPQLLVMTFANVTEIAQAKIFVGEGGVAAAAAAVGNKLPQPLPAAATNAYDTFSIGVTLVALLSGGVGGLRGALYEVATAGVAWQQGLLEAGRLMQLARWLSLDEVGGPHIPPLPAGAATRARVHTRTRAMLDAVMARADANRCSAEGGAHPWFPCNAFAEAPLRHLLPAQSVAPQPCIPPSSWLSDQLKGAFPPTSLDALFFDSLPKPKPKGGVATINSDEDLLNQVHRNYVTVLTGSLVNGLSRHRMVHGVSAAPGAPCLPRTLPAAGKVPDNPGDIELLDEAVAADYASRGLGDAAKPGTAALLDVVAGLLSPGVRPGDPTSTGSLAEHVAAIDAARAALARQEAGATWAASAADAVGAHLACVTECERVAGSLRTCTDADAACQARRLATACAQQAPFGAASACSKATAGIRAADLAGKLATGGPAGSPVTAAAACRRTACSPDALAPPAPAPVPAPAAVPVLPAAIPNGFLWPHSVSQPARPPTQPDAASSTVSTRSGSSRSMSAGSHV